MLEPTARHLFTDGLRPPSGFRVDQAVGTTYTLSLSTLLLPPLAMAAHDRQSETEDDDNGPEGARVDIALLEAVRRFTDRMTVFCHAGAIHVPSHYRRILTFAEESIAEVLPSNPDRIFHPKMWALRFTDGDTYRHRLLILSRNLTRDSAWDTVVQLEEAAGGHLDGRPAADFLRALPGLAAPIRTLSDQRAHALEDLADTLSRTSFAVPAPYRRGDLWPLGVTGDKGWPMDGRPRQSLVISPFLDASTVQRTRAWDRSIVVSRPETFAFLGGGPFEGVETRVLDPHAERDPSDEPDRAVQPWEVRSGLHAKVMVWDYDGSGWLFIGSANATGAAFGGNVEFGLRLRGARRYVGLDEIFPTDDGKGHPTLSRVMVPYEIPDEDPEPDATREAEVDIGRFHARLAMAGARLHVEPASSEDRYDVSLTFSSPPPASPGSTRVRLLSREHGWKHLDATPEWSTLALAEITAFLVVETTVDVEGQSASFTLTTLLNAELFGAPGERQARVLRELLQDQHDVLRYLAFLLDESGADTFGLGLDTAQRDEGGRESGRRVTFDDLALVETLVRAAARGDDALHDVNRLLQDLQAADKSERAPQLSADFLATWTAVWDAVGTEPETTS